MSLARRVQLAPPQTADSKQEAPSAPANQKRSAAELDLAVLSPPRLVKRLVLAQRPSTDEDPRACVCAPGCLRHPDHIGLCHTADGPAPPSIKAMWARAKACEAATWEQYRSPTDEELDDENQAEELAGAESD